MKRLGMNVEEYSFHDVFSTEDWALEMVPKPVIGVLMLFPITMDEEDFSQQQQDQITANGQIVSDKVHFIKQTIGNACGTIGLLHSIVNAHDYHSDNLFAADSYLSNFIQTTKSLDPESIADYLEDDEELECTHVEAAEEGQTEAIMDVETHFICFSKVDGHLYEFDGRKNFPINHGATTTESLLEDSCRVIKQFMDRQPGELRFTMVALCKAPPAEPVEDDEEDEDEEGEEGDAAVEPEAEQ
jgi:ubiquitin carboxyl-terminal hydrolase L3